RLAAMLSTLAAVMPAGAEWTRPRGGHSVWVTLPTGTDADVLRQAAFDVGLHYTPGDVFCGPGQGTRCLALSFANHTPAEITTGVRLLGSLLAKQLGRS